MKKVGVLVWLLVATLGVQASWYWPFGSDEEKVVEDKPPRLSELMEPASLLIDEATDLAADGKASEAVEKYRKALSELDRIEVENPDRAKTAEFASLRNKRAYVNAAIDSMLLSQVKSNAKVVAVSDTTELEKKLAEEREGKEKGKVKGEKVAVKKEKKGKEKGKVKGEKVAVKVKEKGKVKGEKVAVKAKEEVKAKPQPLSRSQQAMADIAKGDYAAADIVIGEMLQEKPNSATALNLKAMSEVRQGKFKEAERTLDRAIMSNPRSYYAYYNMADLILRVNPNGKAAAKRYYETGRAMGGPVETLLESVFK